MSSTINDNRRLTPDADITTTQNAGGDAPLPPVDAEATVTIADRGMTARIYAARPKNGGRPLDREMIDAAIEKAKVVYGLNEDKIASLAVKPIYNLAIAIAEGTSPVPGTDGSLRYHVEREKSLRPKTREDGTVDYRELGLIQQAKEGDILVERTPPTVGTDGSDVLGNVLPAHSGRDVALPAGRNTVISEDGLYLLAAKTGHIEVAGGKVIIQDTYTVSGDVCVATGNINFDGNVSIRGGVLAGFTVKATGNIAVRGVCEAAEIIAGGNVTVGEGINGGSVVAEGDLNSKYLQNCQADVGGTIHSESILGCELRCGALIVSGSRGTLMGGSCSAASLIDCANIGSRNTHVPTRIEVGLDPKIQARMQAAPVEYEQAARMIVSLDHVINVLSQLEAAKRLDKERILHLRNARYTREMEHNNYLALKEEMAELNEKAKSLGYGTIIAKTGIAPGVRIVIGPYQVAISDFHPNARVTRGEDGIVFNMAV